MLEGGPKFACGRAEAMAKPSQPREPGVERGTSDYPRYQRKDGPIPKGSQPPQFQRGLGSLAMIGRDLPTPLRSLRDRFVLG